MRAFLHFGAGMVAPSGANGLLSLTQALPEANMFQSRYLLLLLALAAVTLPARAEIYRYYDADGNLVLSDSVPKERAERVERVTPKEVMTVPALKQSAQPLRTGRKAVADPEKVSYAIIVQSPAQGGSYPRGPEPVPVAVSVSPSLLATHRLEFLLDGKAAANLATIPVEEMTAGTHELAIRISDAKGKVLQSSTITFQVQ